jgi:hypothetical protein
MDTKGYLLIGLTALVFGRWFYTILRWAFQGVLPQSASLYRFKVEVGQSYYNTANEIVTIVREDQLQTKRFDDFQTFNHIVFIGDNKRYYTDRGHVLELYPNIPLPPPPKDLVRKVYRKEG